MNHKHQTKVDQKTIHNQRGKKKVFFANQGPIELLIYEFVTIAS